MSSRGSRHRGAVTVEDDVDVHVGELDAMLSPARPKKLDGLARLLP